MVIHHAGGLHVCINNGAAYKTKTAFFKILAQSIGDFRCCWHRLLRAPLVLDRLAVYKPPDIITEAAMLGLNLKKCACITNGLFHFESIADNGRVL